VFTLFGFEQSNNSAVAVVCFSMCSSPCKEWLFMFVCFLAALNTYLYDHLVCHCDVTVKTRVGYWQQKHNKNQKTQKRFNTTKNTAQKRFFTFSVFYLWSFLCNTSAARCLVSEMIVVDWKVKEFCMACQHSLCSGIGKGKGKCIAVCINTYTATGNHLPYGITQCYLPPGRGNFSAFTASWSWYSI